MENPRMGRTEGFTEVQFETDQPVGQIVPAVISGRTLTNLRVG
jgi:threonylcarbamoyladenosine tRNA methylthiotransferase MtaB